MQVYQVLVFFLVLLFYFYIKFLFMNFMLYLNFVNFEACLQLNLQIKAFIRLVLLV